MNVVRMKMEILSILVSIVRTRRILSLHKYGLCVVVFSATVSNI